MPDTIAAIATAPAAAAVGIVRLSGAETRRVLAALFTPVDGRSAAELPPRRMTYGTVRDAEGRTLDHALAVVFSAGHSYTGEESAELHCHGSPVVLQEVLRAAFAAGARQARAGEFTERAFLNGKMDLTEAEAVIDLIDAETADAAANAAGLPDNARIDLTSYSGATVKELRSWAAGEDLEHRSFYRNDLEPRFVDVAKVSRQLQCSADYICGTIDQPWPIVPLSETLESNQPPKWSTGTPPASGYYFCKFDCAGVTLRNDAIYNAASDTWCFPRGTTKIDAVCTAWVRLPGEDDA